MIKCLACGFEAERLQWTHFKWKCSGKFANSAEYRSEFPGAPLVSPELAKRTAVTEEVMKAKYGDIDGELRWKSYCTKQAVSNSLAYKKERHGWSEEQFKEYNSSRSQTLEKMILRHGETEGTSKWIEYCERQCYTNTKTYFIEKYGQTVGNKKYTELNHKKGAANNPVHMASVMNITIDEAVDLIIARQNANGFILGSRLEKEFTTGLESLIGKLDHSTLSSPFGKWSTLLDSYVIYDIKHQDCVIEFNGDYWHANPNIYTDTAIIRGRTALEIRNRDQQKLQTVIDMGFRTMTVWEYDYRLNKQETLERVVKWMQSGQQ